MSTRKFSLVLLLCLFLLSGGLTACRGNNNSAANAPTGGEHNPSDKNRMITIMTRDSIQTNWPAYQKKVEEVTGVNIKVVAAPTNPDDMVAKMTTILSSGDNSIDILHVNDELITSFSRACYLEPLEKDVMTPDIVENYSQQYVKDMITYKDSIFSVPSYLDVLVFWVNHEKLKQVGMDVPKTKEEFLAFAKAITKGDVYGYGGAWERSYVFNEIGTFINLFGGDFYDWSNPRTREALTFMHDLVQKDKVTPISQLADIYDPMIQKFIDGKYGMLFMYTSAIPTFRSAGKYGPDKLDIVPMPNFGTNDAYMASWHYVLNKSSGKKEDAKKVLTYFASKEGQLSYNEMSGKLPARLDVINDPNFKGLGVEKIRDYIKNGNLRGRPMLPQTMEYINGIGSIFQKYVSDEITLDEAARQAKKESDRLIVIKQK
ncbi:extracellular solute-binding protein [Paenibacillus frigoriresistens]|uniref:ABC transporter substrate-binding protein n=1 Tax=Paenibacillus alginolyticus TaxID=59839 RepID=UPI001567369A|nr:extracellular solute-binding protein [Paenibacillus frigoriresistens]NRF96195.1 extracellular solute-binding protein [Paenibacillus frigoriresistens]